MNDEYSRTSGTAQKHSQDVVAALNSISEISMRLAQLLSTVEEKRQEVSIGYSSKHVTDTQKKLLKGGFDSLEFFGVV